MKRWVADAASPAETPAPPDQIVEWLKSLRLLYGVPLGHLVPDVRMLPNESLRFFALDRAWLDALCDGALSIRRAAAGDAALRAALIDEARDAADRGITGFLLRSVVVWRWPTLEVSAYGEGDAPLEPLRCDRAAPDVLVGLYPGTLRAVSFSEPAETQHFGFEVRGDELHKELRSLDGDDVGRELGETVIVPMRDRRVVDVNALRERLAERLGPGDFTPAEFALELVQGVDRVRFGSEPAHE